MQYVFFFILGSIAASLIFIAAKVGLIAHSLHSIYMCNRWSRLNEYISSLDSDDGDHHE